MSVLELNQFTCCMCGDAINSFPTTPSYDQRCPSNTDNDLCVQCCLDEYGGCDPCAETEKAIEAAEVPVVVSCYRCDEPGVYGTPAGTMRCARHEATYYVAKDSLLAPHATADVHPTGSGASPSTSAPGPAPSFDAA